ncbi:MAG: GNAT family N-acetyltransferase [Oscillospiraceae bacterium]|nr:GNAT family N-acetyltransferase [Oscillospiraceae bacterium]
MQIRPYTAGDLPAMTEIWNQVVEEGMAFPQKEPLNEITAPTFFAGQTLSAVAEEQGEILGLYILHPNNLGRCGHIGNASYAVRRDCRGKHVGEALVRDCLAKLQDCGFRLLQFNAVVCTNTAAIKLYKRLGFQKIGEVPGGFQDKNGVYQDIMLFYYAVS